MLQPVNNRKMPYSGLMGPFHVWILKVPGLRGPIPCLKGLILCLRGPSKMKGWIQWCKNYLDIIAGFIVIAMWSSANQFRDTLYVSLSVSASICLRLCLSLRLSVPALVCVCLPSRQGSCLLDNRSMHIHRSQYKTNFHARFLHQHN